MMKRSVLKISVTAGRNRSMALQTTANTRNFSVASVPSSYLNRNYDVEEHHRREVLEALRTVSQSPDTLPG